MQWIYLLAGVVPFVILDIWYTGVVLLWSLKILIVAYLIVFGICPLIFHYSYSLQRKILFLNFVQWPPFIDFTMPQSVSLEGARNFYLQTDELGDEGVRIGTWQILPKSLINDSKESDDEFYETALSTAKSPVILYIHGNSGNRASSHRVELYKVFQDLDYHVIAFDYRSYGDSQVVDLSEAGVVADSKYVIRWTMNKVNGSAPVFVWGHSLGTGVSCHVLALLAAENIQPTGLFLESPFNNIANEINNYPIAKLFKHLPWFNWVIVKPFYDNHLRFESDRHIANIKCSILILHAEDDRIVPFVLGQKLYEKALKYHGNGTNQLQMVRIDGSLGLGHKYICRYKPLPSIIENFVAKSQKNAMQ